MGRAKFQDVRVRKGETVELRHWESSNSLTLRSFLEQAIVGDADWMNIVTWNDYSETHHPRTAGTRWSN